MDQECRLDSVLLRETNRLARETSDKVSDLSRSLSSHLTDCDGNRAAIALLSKHVGELAAGAEIGDAKINAIAKRVGESVADALDPMRVEQMAMKRRLARLRNIGAGIAAVVIAASAMYAETKGIEVAQKEIRK